MNKLFTVDKSDYRKSWRALYYINRNKASIGYSKWMSLMPNSFVRQVLGVEAGKRFTRIRLSILEVKVK